MNDKNIIASKSIGYFWSYLIALILSIGITIIMVIPVFKIGDNLPYLLTSILFILIDLSLIVLIINYFVRPKNLIELDNNSLLLNRTKKKTTTLQLSNIKRCTISMGFFSMFLLNTGTIKIITKDNKKYVIGYVYNYIKVSGQINSIKYIYDLGDKIKWNQFKNSSFVSQTML